MARPEYLSAAADANFGTRIVRISDQSAFGSTQKFLRHIYSRNQPWNSDGTRIMLDFTYPAALLDGKTMQFIRWMHQPSQAVWSNVDPNKLIGSIASTNELVQMDARNDEIDVLHEFSEYTQIDFGAGEGNLSNDDRYIALFGSANGNTDLLVYDLLGKLVVAKLSFGAAKVCNCSNAGSINNATMSQSGQFVVVQYNERGYGRHKGVEVFDRTLQFLRQLTPGSEHGDVGLTQDGSDVWVAWHDTDQFDPRQEASAFAWRMDSGAATAVIPKGTTLGHISCRNTRRPGYCYASHWNVAGASVLADDQVYAFPLDGGMRVQVFAEQHATEASYEREPMAVPSPDGTSVLWASDWGDRSAPVYAYIATVR